MLRQKWNIIKFLPRTCNMCGRNLITVLTSATSPRVDISSTCKVGQILGVSLPLLTCSPSAWPPRLLYRRGRKSRRDLWITLYVLCTALRKVLYTIWLRKCVSIRTRTCWSMCNIDACFSLILCIVLVIYYYLHIKAAYLNWKLTLKYSFKRFSEQRILITYWNQIISAGRTERRSHEIRKVVLFIFLLLMHICCISCLYKCSCRSFV